MEIPSKEYLQMLLTSAHQKFRDYEQLELDTTTFEITYIPTKKRNFMGLKDGISGLAEMRKYKVNESTTIRSNSMYYQKLYKAEGKVIKVDSFVAGHERLDISYSAYYEGNCRYLFPYTNFGTKSGTHMIVTQYKNGKVFEEYMVSGNQIVYEKYDYANEGIVQYYYINYVPTGTYPVLAEASGHYLIDTLEYVQEQSSVWYQEG